MPTGVSDEVQPDYLLNDEPLTLPSQDRLGFAPFAEMLARAIVNMQCPNGFVLAVYGEWGSGKTSILNFVAVRLEQLEPAERPLVVQFNPWWFSGRDQLLLQFFAQLRSALRQSDVSDALKRTGEALDTFAHALTPLTYVPVLKDLTSPLALVKEVSDGLQSVSDALKQDVWRQRKAICDALRSQDRRIVFIIDDVDRLPVHEIRDMFRVIKAVADFPNTVYLLAFDRDVVVKALSEDVSSGEAYLEKIVQAPYTLPSPSPEAIGGLLEDQTVALLRGTPDELVGERDLASVRRPIQQLVRTPRDVKRYVNAVRPTYAAVRGEVYASDFLAIEALRVFAPAVYDAVRSSQALLAGSADSYFPSMDVTRADLEAFRAEHVASLASPVASTAVHAILARIFPAYAERSVAAYAMGKAGTRRKLRRVCNAEAFQTYFRLCPPDGAIPSSEMRLMLSHLSDPKKLARDLRRLAMQAGPGHGVSRVREFLERLQDYTERDIPVEDIDRVLRGLYQAGDDVLGRPDKLYASDDENWQRTLSTTFRLISRLRGQGRRFVVLRSLVSEAPSLGACVRLVHELGSEHGEYEREMRKKRPEEECAVSSSQLAELERLAAERIRQASRDGGLGQLPRLGSVLLDWCLWTDGQEARECFRKLTEDDTGFVDLVSEFAIVGYRTDEMDPDHLSSCEVDATALSTLAPLALLGGRAKGILRVSPEWLSGRQRAVLEALVSRTKDPEEER